ncbi:MAG: Hsp70 family protein [Candidatus Helarchaeota archaeon]|nr:Hsp70 family protein [Candidatus Helarchaeota archaeon]
MVQQKKFTKIIGIDFGTCNTAVAVLRDGIPTIIPSTEGVAIVGGKCFPSVIALTADGIWLVGEPALRQAITNPERTVFALKRKIGTDHQIKIGRKRYRPQDLLVKFFKKIRNDAVTFLGDEKLGAVLTVPAYFNDWQRSLMIEAASRAGLPVLKIVSAPTAAALAYGWNKEIRELKVAMLDLGGGHYNVCLMEMGEGVFEVAAYCGDTKFGGIDIDKEIVKYIVAEIQEEHGIDVRSDLTAIARIFLAVEEAKITLSTTLTTQINLPHLTADSTGPKHMTLALTRAKLEELVEPVLGWLDEPIRRALRDAKWEPNDVNKIILVGGPTRMPSVRARFAKNFRKEAERGIDPMECVAIGAAILGGLLIGEVKDLLLLDVNPLSIGVETLGNVFTKVFERNTTIPTKKTEIFTTVSDNQPALEIRIFQGERPRASDNITLGRFLFTGIPPAPRGVPKIQVTFDINASGTFTVSAKDLGTGREHKATITPATIVSGRRTSRIQFPLRATSVRSGSTPVRTSSPVSSVDSEPTDVSYMSVFCCCLFIVVIVIIVLVVGR